LTRCHSSHEHGHGWKDIVFGHSHAHEGTPLPLKMPKEGGKRDDGSRITLIGFASNVLLAGTKGAAGVWVVQDRGN
jgi:hypothetical protein